MKALQFERKIAKFAAARVAGAVLPGRGAKVGPLSLGDVDLPPLPGPGWVRIRPRLAGICGSDLATVDGLSSRYFEGIVSFPFTPGHEVVADTDDGRRVVLEPVLGCVARGIDPVCPQCAAGHLGNCERIAFGHIEPGLQSGFCCSTGGGWSTAMLAHTSQLHSVPDSLSDEDAVMIEPTACAIHGALAGPIEPGDTVAVIGAGTFGLLLTAALARLTAAGTICIGARYPHQQALARRLGAHHVVEPDQLIRVVRRLTGSLAVGDQLTGGADVVFDCVGTSDSIAEALRMVKPRGTVVLVGMPSGVSLNLTNLWHRETRLLGAYAYGVEVIRHDVRHEIAGADVRYEAGTTRRTFELAMDLVGALHLGSMVSATYPLKDYTAALEHAASAGRRGAVKIAFDLRKEKERKR
ncbi:MAG: zinc-binding dehydrogenase [Acidimicrobiia bacterium]